MNAVVPALFAVELSKHELDVIRTALRMLEESHKRNDFKVLALEAQELRSKVNDVLIGRNLNHGV
jgi:hypothetical protein